MILINLLPHREAARKRRREGFFVALGAAVVAGLLVAGGVYLWFAAQIADQQDRNAVLQKEITKLDAQIKEVANLQSEIAALRARQQAVEDLQADRNLPVHLLTELSTQLPDGVFLSSLKQSNEVVTITGVAQSNERVSEFLRNLAYNSKWLTRPELVEIVAGSVNLGPKDTRRVANFSMRVRLLRASEAAKAASAAAAASAAGPASAAKAATAPASAASAPSKT